MEDTCLQLCREEIGSPVAEQLVRALDEELAARYPEEGTQEHFRLDAGEVRDGQGAFLVAYLDGRAVGCGAVRRLDDRVAEIKRMYVVPAARGQGVGRQILDALETVARQLGAARLVLETGPRQPEAIALYRRAGFCEVPLFGDYLNSAYPELSVCMAKNLAAAAIAPGDTTLDGQFR